MKNAFQMVGAFEKPLTLYTKRPEDKEAWIAAIQDAIDALLLTEPELIGMNSYHIIASGSPRY
jgi:hypothetical protein